jgi:heterodisulfide reductase subunit A-like polyferredoxin
MSQPTPVSKQVMVLGSAPEAGWVARELLGLSYSVQWLSPDEIPSEIPASHPLLALYEGCSLLGLDGHVGSFVARFEQGGQFQNVSASALVVATGNAPYYPAERYGLKLSSNVLKVSQVQQQLAAPRSTGAALPHRNQRIFLMLDLGGETSKESTAETLRLALQLRREWHSEVYVFYQNLKVDTYNLELLTRQMRAQGIIFCRYAKPQIALDEEGIRLTYVEGTAQGDLLVLPEERRPRADTMELAALLRVHVGEDGYFQDLNVRAYRPGLSNRQGIFFAGRCHLDADLPELQGDAIQAAANVDAILGTGYLQPEDVIAHVDSTKCIRCLTCVRTCPHVAVEVLEYEVPATDGATNGAEGVFAARVVDLACRGCGACVANCPVRAIELVGQALPAWMSK